MRRTIPRPATKSYVLNAAPLAAYIWTAAARKLHILDITLLPEHRNRAAGSLLLGQLMAEAKEAGKPVTIYVERFNPSLRLFQRLGFTTIQQQGFHLLLQCAA
jgi:ribosomal protein S18 acetylase RimI-like enzyme